CRDVVHGLRRVDDGDTPAAPVGGGVVPPGKCPHLLDTNLPGRGLLRLGGSLFGLLALFKGHGIRSNASKIRVIAGSHPRTGLTLATSSRTLALFAQQRRRCSQRETALSYAGKPMNEPGMGKTLALTQPAPGQFLLPREKLSDRAHEFAARLPGARAEKPEMSSSMRARASSATSSAPRLASSTRNRWGSALAWCRNPSRARCRNASFSASRRSRFAPRCLTRSSPSSGSRSNMR